MIRKDAPLYILINTEIEHLIDDIRSVTPLFLVGGFVRDRILFGTNEYKDVDIAINYDTGKLMEMLEDIGYHVVPTGLKFGVFQVNLKGSINIDIAHFRTETYQSDSRKPDVKPVTTIEEDLARRDFTINAIALQHDGTISGYVNDTNEIAVEFKIIDPYDGIEDSQQKILRAVGNPKERFSEDALRCFRAIRFAAKYNFSIEENTMKAIQEICKI